MVPNAPSPLALTIAAKDHSFTRIKAPRGFPIKRKRHGTRRYKRGITSTKMCHEITALKAEIITMERRQAYLMKAAVKQAEVRLSIERERAVQEERSRVDQLEELRNVAELENELLKEMVAAEQVNVKLQQKRNQALKWELLRQGGTQEKFDSIIKEVPDLGDTLRADTGHVVHEATAYSMSEAIEHIVSALGDVEEEMRQAFLARDKGGTGILPGSNFKDALRECLPNMPRAERCLLALRFARDEDQSIDYSEFLDFCRRKAQTRESQKFGLVGALAASRSVDPLGVASLGGNRALAATRSSKGMTEEQKLSKNPSAHARGIPRPKQNGREQESGCPEVFKQGFGRQALQAKRKRKAQAFDALVARKVADMIDKRGKDLELMFKRADPAGAGVIPVKEFSECLRALNAVEVAEGNKRKEKLLLTRSDRKGLYRMWAVHGQVHYNDFLRAGRYANTLPLRYSQSLTTGRRPSLARHNTSPPLPRSTDAQGVDESSAPRLQGRKTDKRKAQAAWAEPQLKKAEEELLPARDEVVLAHLSQVLEEKGEEAFFTEFEERDADGCRTVDEDDFMDAMSTFAPEVTTEQALDVFRARSSEAEGSIAYDKFFEELRKMARPGGFQSGEDVQFRVEDREGRLHWVNGQVVSRDEDSTYTVRFKSRVPGRGYVEECGVIEGHLRMETPLKKTKTTVVGKLKVRAASWWMGLPKRLSRAKETGAVLVSVQLKRLLGGNTRDSVKKSTTGARADESVDSGESRDHRRSRHRRSTGAADSEASVDVSSSGRGSSASTSSTEQRPGGFEPHQHEGLLEGDISRALPSAHSPSAASHTKKLRGSSNGSDGGRGSGMVRGSGGTGKRRTVELPEVQKVSPPPQGKLQDSSHGHHRKTPSPSVLHRKDPAVDHFSGSGRRGTGRNATLRHGRDERRSSGGLKSLEASGDERIENKFDLYKKRTKAALSPEKRSYCVSSKTSGSGNRRLSGQVLG